MENEINDDRLLYSFAVLDSDKSPLNITLHRIATEKAAEVVRLRAENSGLAQMLAGQRIDLAQARAELGDTHQ